MTSPLTWPELEALTDWHIDYVNGPTNAQSKLRLFGHDESEIRVTLFRDNHAWCPYCQKIWLWLEEKRIPYRIEKVTMFCYGEKEQWYKRKVPSGMLPAIELDGKIITESDDILIVLEQVYGELQFAMADPRVMPMRRLERLLFRAWCNWLCYNHRSAREETFAREKFQEIMGYVEEALAATPGPYFLEEFSTADVIFTPYVERMNASLYYYKGYSMREMNQKMSDWFDAMESRPTYRGTQSDFHTHSHDLPPQMGGCYTNGEDQAKACADRVDNGPWVGLPDVTYAEPETTRQEALARMLKHRANIIRVNPTDDATIDTALRCALTQMMTGEAVQPPKGSDVGLRYLRDRINVPRDMSIYAGKRLREALESTAALAGDRPGPEIPVRHRRDQNPLEFQTPSAFASH
ncbi:glutathione S-transferase family protein [filamentous cyanobacterium LEGE 11480]|uniref:Glutathione S-transferase family protein n=1 Tax=Romeriopsis navalis LEGE 11480 TaxID=2777977 RepID=A0A928Z4W7_9CYAN|nr:glutathione S-transferase family protein [Romeriopsis navalis]MBE9032179.1 glutathione S-transferase family protein [Romeriopsis navalis LEGE 11480]